MTGFRMYRWTSLMLPGRCSPWPASSTTSFPVCECLFYLASDADAGALSCIALHRMTLSYIAWVETCETCGVCRIVTQAPSPGPTMRV